MNNDKIELDRKTAWFLEDSVQPSLRMWVFTQMCVGAAYSALLFFGVIAFILILRAISYLLPEDPYAILDTAGQAASLLA